MADAADPEKECEQVLNAVLPLAEQMLNRDRGFLPFGGTLSAEGEITCTGGWSGDDRPDAEEAVEMLQEDFRSGARSGEYKATALVCDVRAVFPDEESERDAIAISLDHRADWSIVLLFPYAFGPDGEVVIDDPFSVTGEDVVFSD